MKIKKEMFNMATSMTKKQIEEINHKCSNNWKFDVIYFVYHEGKTLIKKLKVDNIGYFEFKLYYNNQNQITLNIRKYYYKETERIAVTNSAGKNIVLDKTELKRKSLKNLIEITAKLTDEELLKMNAETE